MRITFVIPNKNLSGGIRIVSEHARMLHEKGHTVTVVAGRIRRDTLKDRIRAGLRGRLLARKSELHSHLESVPFRVHTIDRARPIVEDDVPDADLIIATWWETAEWVAAMPKCKGVQVNFLQGYDANSMQPKDRVDAVWRHPMRKIVVSKWLKQIAREQFGDSTAILVPNGIDTNAFDMNLREPSGQRIVGAMMTPVHVKRFDLACEVIRELDSRGDTCRFIGFGSHPVESGVLPIDAEFELIPTQERIAEIYGMCDCWLFTSKEEGYGLPLLESLSCGTPVVATPAGAAEELLASGGGRVVYSDDPKVIADAVEAVLSCSRSEWGIISQTGRDEAKRHSWDVIGGEMEAALYQCIEKTQAGVVDSE